MPQTASFGDPPIRQKDDLGVVNLKRTKSSSSSRTSATDASLGTLNLTRGGRTAKATQPISEESKGVWSKLNTGLISPETGTKIATLGLSDETLDNSERYFKFKADEAKKNGHPLAYAYDTLQGYVAGAGKAEGEFVSSLSSPGSLALQAASWASGIGEAKTGASVVESLGVRMLRMGLRAPGRGAGAYFAVKGLQMARTPQQEGENKYDSFWRRAMGLSAMLGTGYSAVSTAHAYFPKFIQHYFGLSDDLANKVSSQVNQISKIRAQREGNIQAIDTETRQQIRGLRDSLQQEVGDVHAHTHSTVQAILTQTEQLIERNKGKLSDVQKQSLRDGAHTVADTMQAFLQEKARVGVPFDRIAEQIKGDVAYSPEIHEIIASAFKDSGLDPAEIPPRAEALLKMPEPDEAEAPAGITLRGPDGKTQLVNEKYVQGWLDRGYERVGGISGEGGLDFERLTRVREDLGQAAEAAKDTGHKRALFKARDDVTDLQEKIAQKKGQGDAYRKAKQDYTKFVRGIGSDMVHTFLDASDAEAQTMAPKIAEFMRNREIGDGLRGVLKAAGVDVGPLDKLLDMQDEIEEANKVAERDKNLRIAQEEKSGVQKERGVREDIRDDIRATERRAADRTGEEKAALKEEVHKAKAVPIRGKKTVKQMFGKDAEELSGLDRQRLKEALIREQMNRASAGGMGQWAYWTLGYGLLKIGMGSPFGIPGVLIGGTRVSLPRSLENPVVQDWVIRESGIDPKTPAGIRARKGLTHLQRMLRSGAPQAAAEQAAEKSLGDIPKRK